MHRLTKIFQSGTSKKSLDPTPSRHDNERHVYESDKKRTRNEQNETINQRSKLEKMIDQRDQTIRDLQEQLKEAYKENKRITASANERQKASSDKTNMEFQLLSGLKATGDEIERRFLSLRSLIKELSTSLIFESKGTKFSFEKDLFEDSLNVVPSCRLIFELEILLLDRNFRLYFV